MNTLDWKTCPIDMTDLNLSDDKLRGHWDEMHRGNLEPYPEDATLQESWRQYHLGNFAKSAELGLTLGDQGAVPVAFATTIYAQYIETDSKRKIELFKKAMSFCKDAEDNGLSTPNLHYIHAVAMGRYSQFISMLEALAQGFGGRIKEQVLKCLEQSPNHAEALVTYAGWHAGITDQAGTLMGKMLYGATQEGAQENYDKAIKAAPQSIIPHIEYARGLEIMYGDEEHDAIIKHLETAMQLTPADAMQRLDLQAAKEQLAGMK